MTLPGVEFEVTLREATALGMREGDLLLWRADWRPAGFLIGVFGRGGLCHAAQVCAVGASWWLQEVTQWRGGGQRPLRRAIEEEPGRILWYAANAGGRWPEWRPAAAVRRFAELLGCHYGWWNLVKAGLLHVPVLRLLLAGVMIRQATDDRAAQGRAPFCSQAVAIAARAGGVDPVPHLADGCTEPADLARSLFYQYRGTLVPEPLSPSIEGQTTNEPRARRKRE